MSNEHREQAREPERIKVCIRAGKEDWIGVAYATETADPSAIHEYISASALSSRDAEVREVLEGVLEFCDQVIEVWEIRPTPAHRVALQRARDLFSKLQAPELQEENK